MIKMREEKEKKKFGAKVRKVCFENKSFLTRENQSQAQSKMVCLTIQMRKILNLKEKKRMKNFVGDSKNGILFFFLIFCFKN